jgi:hypothetical protein
MSKIFFWLKHHIGQQKQFSGKKNINIYSLKYDIYIYAIQHILSSQNAMTQMGFDPGTSHIVSHHSTN